MPTRRGLHLLVLLQIAQNCAAASKSAAGTTPCSSAFPGDLKVEACGGFCKEAKSKDHCPRCQCRACPFCAPTNLNDFEVRAESVKLQSEKLERSSD